jgi:ATP adenylyltransferase
MNQPSGRSTSGRGRTATTAKKPAAVRAKKAAASAGTAAVASGSAAAQAAVSGGGDGLDRLWTPHRMAYVTGADRPSEGYDRPAGCPFCLAPGGTDEDGLVLARGERVFALLNLYPYNPGHLIVCPYRHVADYAELDAAEAVELAAFTQIALRAIRRVSGAHGFNVGMNLGAVAGAGIAAHLHQHVVPRWGGDTNFMPVIGQTKVLPQLLRDTRDLLAKVWESAQGS